jgi:hypothetical protein
MILVAFTAGLKGLLHPAEAMTIEGRHKMPAPLRMGPKTILFKGFCSARHGLKSRSFQPEKNLPQRLKPDDFSSFYRTPKMPALPRGGDDYLG